MKRNYYYLVSGLKEYSIDSDTKGFDAVALRDEIATELAESDRDALVDLYTFYDISNIISLWGSKSSFSELGVISKNTLSDEIENPTTIKKYIADILTAYRNKIKEDKYAEIDENIDTSLSIEKNLWNAYYDAMSKSNNAFISAWYDFDKNLKNVCAAFTARKQEKEIAPELIGEGDIIVSLSRSSAADFGLKSEIDYIDKLIPILDTTNMLEKERRLDLLRWEMADELTTFDYFTTDRVLAYCIKLNIIHRWMSLDAVIGREMFSKLIAELVDKEVLDNAVKEAETTK